MKFELLFLGKTREKYLDQGIRDYAQRLSRYVPLEIRVLKDRNRHAKNDSEQVIMAREAKQLLSRMEKGSFTVALDPQGREQSSEELARTIENWENQGMQTISFLIGGHLGLAPEIQQLAAATWSLSRLTFTHEMSRFILLEQLYRAWTIKAGHNYHK